MLLNNFYTLLSSESLDETVWTIHVELHPEHALYQGHFPAHPVVPGVCLLQIIKESVESIRQHKLQYAQIASCKFLSAIHPAETPQLHFTLTMKETEEGKLQLQAEGTVVKENTEAPTTSAETSKENAASECFIKLKAVLTP